MDVIDTPVARTYVRYYIIYTVMHERRESKYGLYKLFLKQPRDRRKVIASRFGKDYKEYTKEAQLYTIRLEQLMLEDLNQNNMVKIMDDESFMLKFFDEMEDKLQKEE